jgi:hypothetical protein
MLAAAAKSDEAARLILELGGGSTDGSDARPASPKRREGIIDRRLLSSLFVQMMHLMLYRADERNRRWQRGPSKS